MIEFYEDRLPRNAVTLGSYVYQSVVIKIVSVGGRVKVMQYISTHFLAISRTCAYSSSGSSKRRFEKYPSSFKK